MFWAGTMFGCRVPLVPIQGNMTAAVYENNILQSIVSGFAGTVGGGFTLQEDNALPLSMQWFLVGCGIYRMNWSLCSPDMNCIENAWSFLKTEICSHVNDSSIKNAALEEWENFPQESFNAMVWSLPRRIQECLRIHEGLTC